MHALSLTQTIRLAQELEVTTIFIHISSFDLRLVTVVFISFFIVSDFC